ncbi:MAG: hypothetical protein HKN94_01360 [Acidimicrobiales bacterium]|nr:hypothetical protein [Acidimicrobiales bacterium]RZV45313.1 MAG: hypothetical protein EX269_10215 [Acidimicrobiales bacterium]
MTRSHVPFDALWSMAIDVPYSYLLRDDGLAWTCGQIALDLESEVLHPGDLVSQSSVVCGHITSILERAKLDAGGLRRLYLYYASPNAGVVEEMLATFRARFGPAVLLEAIPVPHFYYDGILLEVDVWWAESADELRFGSAVAPTPSAERLSEHLVVPTEELHRPHDVPDPGAVIDGGAKLTEAMFLSVELPGHEVTTDMDVRDGVITVLRRAGSFTWLQGRSTQGARGLVEQTDAIMSRFDEVIESLGLTYADVAKSTTHYVGGSSAEELHGNMAVRNRRYTKPGPASTGLPVYGFAAPASKVVVDLTLLRR